METSLIPSVETLPREIIELMRLVFKAKSEERSTAMELLNHPLIINGTYLVVVAFKLIWPSLKLK